MAVVGKYILENLTTGMYQDSKIIFREYIQNACDQIDKAVEADILGSKADGSVEIFIDSNKRYISIEDNATGVKAGDFKSTLGDIANSDKTRGVDKGFRGIGRLCGLAYCKTLVFTTSFSGEKVKSIMTCDASTMTKMIYEKTKYSVDEILDKTITFSVEKEAAEKHYFKVELIDVNESNSDLLDKNAISSYLSFVAPVAYKNTFILCNKIYNFAKNNGFSIDEYSITVNGKPVYKDYTCNLKTKTTNGSLKNYDSIEDLQFEVLKSEKDTTILAWFWYGVCCFDTQIPDCNPMRGFRVRTGNIQIGKDNVMQDFFKETRGNYYFIGEIFTVHPDLIPNSQRDYFNENEIRVDFENCFRQYAFDILHPIYYKANQLKNAYKKQTEYANKVTKFNEKKNQGQFLDQSEMADEKKEIDKAKDQAEKAKKTIENSKTKETSPVFESVRNLIEKKYDQEIDKDGPVSLDDDTQNKKNNYFSQHFSKLSKRERKIMSKILSIISQNVDKDTAIKIREQIEKELN